LEDRPNRFCINHKLPLDLALAIHLCQFLPDLLVFFLSDHIHKADKDVTGKHTLLFHYFLRIYLAPLSGRHHRNDRMQLCIDAHLFIEPKLLYGCCGIGQAVGLDHDISDRSIVDNILDGRNEVVS